MSKISFSSLTAKLFSRHVQRWADVARDASDADLPLLRRQTAVARKMKGHLNRLIHTADVRLAEHAHADTISKPHNADWAVRPALWRGALPLPGLSSAPSKTKMGEDVTLFHDCTLSEITLRQVRNLKKQDTAPYGLQLDVFQFDGSFLSLVIDIDEAGAKDLKRSHVLRMDTLVELEKPVEIFARLNIKNGPNTEQIVREFPSDAQDGHTIEFDLAYSSLNEKRVERAWIDLIFEGPQMNQVILRDLTFSRYPRANL